MILQKDIDLIKASVNMLELAKEYTALKIAGEGIWQGKCPNKNHQDDTPSFVVWEKSSSWACMGCHNGKKSNGKNYGSDCIAFIQWIEGISFKKAIKFLAKKYNISLEPDPNQDSYDNNMRMALSYNKNISPSILQYLHYRGINDKSIKEWLIGFDGSHITFPLFNKEKNIIGFSRRNMKSYGCKYVNSHSSELFQKNNYFYGIHNIDLNFNEIRVTEGAIDVILAHQNGLKNIVGTLGTSFTENHKTIIQNSGLKPVFCMDGDKPGIASAQKAIESLSKLGIYSKLIIFPNNMDLAEMSLIEEDIEKYINMNSKLYSYILIESYLNSYNSKISEAKLEILPNILSIIESTKSKEEKIILKDLISKYFSI